MRSNFRRIGNYIQQTNTRNNGIAVTNLQGVSINKLFMPSVANINGTDLSIYKAVAKGQFAFNPMHVGRDEVLPIAMLETDDPVIVSPAYVVFEIIDKQALLPEYLMMWCRRPEFDRNAWFTTDSSVRGGFSWNDFFEMELPVPSPEKQREIVKEYHTIVDRIKLNERLNRKLEETAQTIYKQWFVDFEFPITAEYAAAIGKPELEGKPYKSSGGEMVFNKGLDQEIPLWWETKRLGDFINIKHGFAFKGDYFTDSENENILLSPGNFKVGGGFKADSLRYYSGKTPQDYIFRPGDIMVTMTDLSKLTDTLGYPAIIPNWDKKNLLHNQRLGKVEYLTDIQSKYYVFYTLCSFEYRKHIISGATGTTVKHTSPNRIMAHRVAMSNDRAITTRFELLCEKIQARTDQIFIENNKLTSLKDLLNVRMVRDQA